MEVPGLIHLLDLIAIQTYPLHQLRLLDERRPLRSVPTVGSHFKVDPEVLARDYVEKETKVSRDIYIRNETIFNDIALKFF